MTCDPRSRSAHISHCERTRIAGLSAEGRTVSGSHVSETLMAEVEAVLPVRFGEPPKRIHAALGKWSIISVRHALRQLVEAGRATYDGPDGARYYRRVQS